MLRIVAGEFGGRRLKAPPGTSTRPTAEKVRAAVFNILGPPPDGARVLDLFAGAGALGLEALSRGAAHATFVDHDGGCVRVVDENLRALGVTGAARVWRLDAVAAAKRLAQADERFDWIFVDPPYARDAAAEADGPAAKVLAQLAERSLLAPGGLVVVEHDRRHAPPERQGALSARDVRKYGDTCVTFYREDGDDPA